MGSLGNPKTWVPYMNTKDCSQGFCSLYCPQWCYIIFPPPPPFEFPNENSTPNFSPLVIAIIGILASAFLLVSYYAIISKFCANMDSSQRDQNHNPSVELEENRDPSNHEPWHGTTNGLDEAIIKSITIHKFKKGDGFVQGTDCPVCLSEFEDDESLRLLPKCTHLFHVKCIDTWLRSHSNCPLCRASVGFVNALETNVERNDSFAALEAMETRGEGEILQNNVVGSSVEGDSIIEIRDEEEEENRGIRRSVSMGYLSQTRVSIMDMLRIDQDGDFHLDEGGSSKRPRIEMSQCSSHRSRVLHCVMSPISMKRSFSSGRFSFARRGRGGRIVIPV